MVNTTGTAAAALAKRRRDTKPARKVVTAGVGAADEWSCSLSSLMVSAFVVRLAGVVAILMLTSPALRLGAVFHTLTADESNQAPLNGWLRSNIAHEKMQ